RCIRDRPGGCPACNHSGFKGRTGIHELFVIHDDIRRLIHEGGDEQAMRAAARRHGMRNMRDDGQRWVRAGITSAEEILRVTRDA
ncbi:type II secretion system protein GspE, partial [Azoarcus sp. TTM-91]|nr:type II secretion system protein GspE [Azoarcus sp. TTM-91]